MQHDLPKLQVLKLVIKEIKYYFDIDTNRDFLKRIGYSSPTYLSDLYAGKTQVSDKFINKLQETFLVNPEVFTGDSCDMFMPESEVQIRVTADGKTERAMKKSVHVHYGNNSADRGGIAGELITQIDKDCLDKMARMHAETVDGFKEALAVNSRVLQEMEAQRKEFQSTVFEELKAQREMFLTVLSLLNKEKPGK